MAAVRQRLTIQSPLPEPTACGREEKVAGFGCGQCYRGLNLIKMAAIRWTFMAKLKWEGWSNSIVGLGFWIAEFNNDIDLILIIKIRYQQSEIRNPLDPVLHDRRTQGM
jgi:hypothetical protein